MKSIMNDLNKILQNGIKAKLLSIDGDNIIYEIQKNIYKFYGRKS